MPDITRRMTEWAKVPEIQTLTDWQVVRQADEHLWIDHTSRSITSPLDALRKAIADDRRHPGSFAQMNPIVGIAQVESSVTRVFTVEL